jgi:hypothetical protein
MSSINAAPELGYAAAEVAPCWRGVSEQAGSQRADENARLIRYALPRA